MISPEWIGFTSGKTQAARYDLSKQIGSVNYNAPKNRLQAFDHQGLSVVDQSVAKADLADYIGKDAAKKLLDSPHPRTDGVFTLSGVDLSVGGEGMAKFYDELLPKRMEKIVKPFGGKVERGAVKADSAPSDVVARYADQPDHPFTQAAERRKTEPAWVVRLTPEMKARIVKDGLPLMSLIVGAEVGRERWTPARKKD